MSYGRAQIGAVFEQAPNVVLINQAMPEPPEPPEEPESELQAKFQLATGICCPRAARIEMEALMRHHGFTAKELKSVWSVGTLQFPYHATRLKVVTSKWEAVWGWVMLALFLVYGFEVFTRLVIILKSGSLTAFGVERGIFALGLLASFGGAILLVIKHHIAPRRLALRLRKVLDKMHAE